MFDFVEELRKIAVVPMIFHIQKTSEYYKDLDSILRNIKSIVWFGEIEPLTEFSYGIKDMGEYVELMIIYKKLPSDKKRCILRILPDKLLFSEN